MLTKLFLKVFLFLLTNIELLDLVIQFELRAITTITRSNSRCLNCQLVSRNVIVVLIIHPFLCFLPVKDGSTGIRFTNYPCAFVPYGMFLLMCITGCCSGLKSNEVFMFLPVAPKTHTIVDLAPGGRLRI